jgi:hypothetical protein
VKRTATKPDTNQKELLDSVKRGEWNPLARANASGLATRATRGHVSQGPAAQHPAIEQRFGGDSEARGRGGLARMFTIVRVGEESVRVATPRMLYKMKRATVRPKTDWMLR